MNHITVINTWSVIESMRNINTEIINVSHFNINTKLLIVSSRKIHPHPANVSEININTN